MKINSSKNGKVRRWLSGGTLAAAIGMLALTPANMGGCAGGGVGSLGSMVGDAVGGPTGQLIKGGSKVANASLMDERHEPAMGQSVAVAVVGKYGLDSREALNKYVNLVGLTIASVTPRADQEFVFGVLNSDHVNAFAGPGGYVMLTRGTVMQCQDESELAGVLAHEVAHVVHQHGLKAMKAAGRLEGMADMASANEDVAQWNIAADGLVDLVVNKGYGRAQEADSDETAVQYLVDAGYDPNGYLRFLQRMHAGNNQSQGGGQLMSTHPGLDDRIKKVQAKIQKLGNPGGATLADRFKLRTGKPAA
jgi:predicted Zn-dependent protease